MTALTVPIPLPNAPYHIVIGEGIMAQAIEGLASSLPSPRIIIITDSMVAPLHLHTLTAACAAAGITTESIILPTGEATKSWECLGQLLHTLLDKRVDRKTTLCALGGGVIGDITGFAASITLRGIPFVQIPTTLLAQVDSSVGGKTGINMPHGKNMVGSFYQPLRVIIDTRLLATLPLRQRRAGYAEILKYALINQPDFFAWLEAHGQAVLDGEPAALTSAIARSCESKAAIVLADEKEQGVRALLNLGHTFGHALEAEMGFSDRLLHGEAVAMGCLMAMRLSLQRGHCPTSDEQRLRQHLQSLGYALTLQELCAHGWHAPKLLAHMAHDKKAESGVKTFILLRGIGHAYLDKSVPDDAVITALQSFIG